jgi:hypothetical protein
MSDNNEQSAPQQPQQTMKQRVELQRGRNVPIDYFLYTCLEHERTKRAAGVDEAQANLGRWPIMVGATLESLPGELKAMDLKGLMSRMSLWYAAQYPEMMEETALDHVMLNQIVEPFMKFTLDLADLVLLKTGTALPAHNADTEESKAVWETIKTVLKEEFPGYYAYFDRFLRWAFADVEPEEIEEGSRPPVGKNMPNFRGNRPQGNGGGGGHQQRHGQGGGGGRDHRGNRDNRGGRGDHRDNRDNRDNRGGRDHRGGGGQHQKPRHGQGGGGGGGGGQQADAEIEAQALAAVDEAISKITSGEVEEVFLKPVNSFYRRIQHQYAVDKGFESCSVGEGNERGVKVAKKN